MKTSGCEGLHMGYYYFALAFFCTVNALYSDLLGSWPVPGFLGGT